jgi:transcriptional regulator NrdR family protein
MKDCTCHFCAVGVAHPGTHVTYSEVTGGTRVADSLDSADWERRFACDTCGHVFSTLYEEVPPA